RLQHILEQRHLRLVAIGQHSYVFNSGIAAELSHRQKLPCLPQLVELVIDVDQDLALRIANGVRCLRRSQILLSEFVLAAAPVEYFPRHGHADVHVALWNEAVEVEGVNMLKSGADLRNKFGLLDPPIAV